MCKALYKAFKKYICYHTQSSLQAHEAEIHTLISHMNKLRFRKNKYGTTENMGLSIQADTSFYPSSATYQSCAVVEITITLSHKFFICNLSVILYMPQNSARILCAYARL